MFNPFVFEVPHEHSSARRAAPTHCVVVPFTARSSARGRDDDCDGTTDEEIAPSGTCSAGVGACGRMGVLACSAASFSRFSVVAGLPSAETCNGIDDDCNGSADEGTCMAEPGFTCSGTALGCVTTCGDGVRAGLEACDDGFLQSGDGCSAACEVEPGFS